MKEKTWLKMRDRTSKLVKESWVNQTLILLQASFTFQVCCMDICKNGNKLLIVSTKVWNDLKTITGGTSMYVG